MSRLRIRESSELQASTAEALEPVKLNGQIADIYLQFANSETALRTYLQMEVSLRKGSLNDSELEAIKLWVSEQTGCQFCLSVHSFKSRQAGLDEAQQLAIRTGRATGDARLDALLNLTRIVYRNPGSIAQSALEEARSAGISDENLVDLTMAISTIFFTNLTNHINDSVSSLPPAPSIG